MDRLSFTLSLGDMAFVIESIVSGALSFIYAKKMVADLYTWH